MELWWKGIIYVQFLGVKSYEYTQPEVNTT